MTSASGDPIRVGLVGFGRASRVFHAPLITSTPGFEITHILERHRSESRASYPRATIVADLDEMLSRDEIDLVVVATPNATHAEIGAQALRAGKHVVIDKPMAVSSSDVTRLAALATERQRVLSVFHNRRWDGDFRTLRQIVERRTLGHIVRVESWFDRFRPQLKPDAWREQAGDGSGVLNDLGPHLIDQALVLFGRPLGLSADIRCERQGAIVDDGFELRLRYERLVVILGAGMLAKEAHPRFLVHGSAGSFVKHGLDPQEAALTQGRTPSTDPAWGTEPASNWGIIDVEVAGVQTRAPVETLPGCYQTFYENVRDAVHGRAPLAVGAEAAFETMRLIEIARTSSAQRREVPG